MSLNRWISIQQVCECLQPYFTAGMELEGVAVKVGLSGTGRSGKLGYLAQDDLESWVIWHTTIRKVGLSGTG
jgi:hypothetical protein